jgi:hypothetical protein
MMFLYRSTTRNGDSTMQKSIRNIAIGLSLVIMAA